MSSKPLTQQQIDQFIEQGYVTLKQGFDHAVARQWADRGWNLLGYDRNDPSTWTNVRIRRPTLTSVEVPEFAPRVWAAVCQLLGGEERIRKPYHFSDAFIWNLGVGADKPWQGPSAQSTGWHKDGDFFRHFLDSPEQGLLTIVCWTDMVHQGGGTFISPDSVGAVARYLAEHPEGLLPNSFGQLIHQCHEFVELTGEPGDVVLHHPYMLHATSPNPLRRIRAITNPPVHLLEPMNFNRPNPAEFSAVERGVLRGLGVQRYDFKPTGPREKIVPERIKKQQQMLEEDRKRAAMKTA